MSDFDKEAERERLREKYERDQQKREASERMSDLLLKGATMTNSHCGNCGDPIFRYDGDEFCPTCQQVVTSDEAADAAAADGQQGDGDASESDSTGLDETGVEAENGDAPDHIEIKQPDGPAVQTGGDQSAESAAGAPGNDAHASRTEADATAGEQSDQTQRGATVSDADVADPAATDVNPTDAAADAAAPETTTAEADAAGESPASQPAPSAGSTGAQPSEATRPQPTRPQQSPATDSPTGSGDASDDFGAARASLVRTLRKHAERAEHCDDPRRARDHLAAAREAAEALSSLSGSY